MSLAPASKTDVPKPITGLLRKPTLASLKEISGMNEKARQRS